MAQSTTMTVRVDATTRRRLERLSRSTSRSKSFLAQEALRAYVDLHEWQVAAIEEGVAAAEAGDLVDDAEVAAWLSSWGRPGERKRR